jgi:hypothetical protein
VDVIERQLVEFGWEVNDPEPVPAAMRGPVHPVQETAAIARQDEPARLGAHLILWLTTPRLAAEVAQLLWAWGSVGTRQDGAAGCHRGNCFPSRVTRNTKALALIVPIIKAQTEQPIQAQTAVVRPLHSQQVAAYDLRVIIAGRPGSSAPSRLPCGVRSEWHSPPV